MRKKLPILEIVVPCVLDLETFIPEGGEIIHVGIDATGIDALIICAPPHYRQMQGEVSFAATHSEDANDFLYLRHDLQGNLLFQTRVSDQHLNFHHACYLTSGEILLVCGRCRFRSPDDIDQNARVFDLQGNFQREFILGDGIQEIQVDAKGKIWTTYFDEGVCGNYGWKEPIGRPGLIRWNAEGNQEWAFAPEEKIDSMVDCYAMNLDADGNCWICYYTDFPFVRIDPKGYLQAWDCPISGSHSLHVHDNQILMDGGYGKENFKLLALEETQLIPLKIVRFKSPDENPLTKRNHIASIGSHIGFWAGTCIYLTNLGTLQ